jgi:hypothetical protein
MPVLTAYIGFSSVSYLFYKSSSDYKFGTFPYVFSEELYGNYSDERKFYKELFSSICKENDVKFSECDIVVGSFIKLPELDFKVKKTFLLDEIINGISSKHYPLVINSYSIISPDLYLSYLPNGEDDCENSNQKIGPEELAYYYNLAIYHNVVPFEINNLVDHDRNIINKLCKNKLEYTGEKPISFMGSRFTSPYGTFNREIDYILLINLIRNPGIYEIELDRDRYLILKYMLNNYVVNSELLAEGKVEKVGTLINTYGGVECMITSEIGTSQLLDIEPDRVFIVPLNYNEKAHITIKNNNVGILEKDVTGGKIGVIFDTREEKYDITSNLKVFNESVKVLSQAFNKL